NAFLCKSFVASHQQLTPSTEPNLIVRTGCATCHATLEPLAAYFSRIEATQWTYLPDWQFSLRNFHCKRNPAGTLPGCCAACHPRLLVLPPPAGTLRAGAAMAQDVTPKEELRLVPQESFLRGYLQLFGGGTPVEVQKRARDQDGGQLFDSWGDYLSS